MNTIFALSSAFGKSGISVFRLSGSNSLQILRLLSKKDNWIHGYVKKVTLYDFNISSKNNIGHSHIIDEAMAVYFKSPKSFTGEDVVEINTHGSLSIYKYLTEVILASNLARMAEPGEFTKRAVINGKMDLTSAEGLIDLIDSETIIQHKQALRQMRGELEKIYSLIRLKILKIMSLLEAYIDFPEEEIPEEILLDTKEKIDDLKNEINKYLTDNRRGEIIRNGLKLAIYGEPNVGKSSLINFLTQRDISIVSDIPGTTRDIIESNLDIGGYPITIADTAGIREFSKDVIEIEGIKRAKKIIEVSDIKILVIDINDVKNILKTGFNCEFELFYKFITNKFAIDSNTILIFNKIDNSDEYTISKLNNFFNNACFTSIKYNINTDNILEKIINLAKNIVIPSEPPAITRARHRIQLKKALEYLSKCNVNYDLELAAEDVRMAARSIEAIIGMINPDHILEEIFLNFCIGK